MSESPYDWPPWIPQFHEVPSPRGTVIVPRVRDAMTVLYEAVTKVPLIREPYLPPPDKYATLVTEYAEGASLTQLAAKYGVTKQSIHYALKQRGATFRPRGRRKGFTQQPSVNSRKAIHHLLKEIAKEAENVKP